MTSKMYIILGRIAQKVEDDKTPSTDFRGEANAIIDNSDILEMSQQIAMGTLDNIKMSDEQRERLIGLIAKGMGA